MDSKRTYIPVMAILLLTAALLGGQHLLKNDKYFTSNSVLTDAAIKDFLEARVLRYDGVNKIFCEYDILGAERVEVDKSKEYFWTYCQSYSLQESKLQESSGISLPVVVTATKTKDVWEPTDIFQAVDGGLNLPENKKNFPPPIFKKAYSHQGSTTKIDPRTRAEKYFGPAS